MNKWNKFGQSVTLSVLTGQSSCGSQRQVMSVRADELTVFWVWVLHESISNLQPPMPVKIRTRKEPIPVIKHTHTNIHRLQSLTLKQKEMKFSLSMPSQRSSLILMSHSLPNRLLSHSLSWDSVCSARLSACSGLKLLLCSALLLH